MSPSAIAPQELLPALAHRELLYRANLRSLARIERFTSEFPGGHPLLPALFLDHHRRRCLLEQACTELGHRGGKAASESQCSICLARDLEATSDSIGSVQS